MESAKLSPLPFHLMSSSSTGRSSTLEMIPGRRMSSGKMLPAMGARELCRLVKAPRSKSCSGGGDGRRKATARAVVGPGAARAGILCAARWITRRPLCPRSPHTPRAQESSAEQPFDNMPESTILDAIQEMEAVGAKTIGYDDGKVALKKLKPELNEQQMMFDDLKEYARRVAKSRNKRLTDSAISALETKYDQIKPKEKEPMKQDAYEVGLMLTEMRIYQGDYMASIDLATALKQPDTSDPRPQLYEAIAHIMLADTLLSKFQKERVGDVSILQAVVHIVSSETLFNECKNAILGDVPISFHEFGEKMQKLKEQTEELRRQ